MIWILGFAIVFLFFIWALMSSNPRSPLDDELQMKAIEEWKKKKGEKYNA